METDKYCAYCGKSLNPVDILIASMLISDDSAAAAASTAIIGRSVLLPDRSMLQSDAQVNVGSGWSNPDHSAYLPLQNDDLQINTLQFRRKKRAWPYVLAGATVVTAAIVFAVMFFNPVRTTYRSAMLAYNEERYEDAGYIFGEIIDYKDSAAMVSKSLYLLAGQKLDGGDYETAKALYGQLGIYQDSAQMIKECDYLYSKDLFNSESWDSAYDCFSKLGDYKDSENMAYSCIEQLLVIATNRQGLYQDQAVLEAYACLEIASQNDQHAMNLILTNQEDLLYSQALIYYAQGDLEAALNVLYMCSSNKSTKLYEKIAGEYYGQYDDYIPGGYYCVTAEPNLRVRSAPNIDGEIIGRIEYGKTVYVIEWYGGWGRINYENNNGWISMDYLESIG